MAHRTDYKRYQVRSRGVRHHISTYRVVDNGLYPDGTYGYQAGDRSAHGFSSRGAALRAALTILGLAAVLAVAIVVI